MQRKFIFLILFLVIGWTLDAHAQLMVEQGKVQLGAGPLQNITGTITVHNTVNEAIRVRAYLEDFEYVAPYDGKKKFLPAGSAQNSVSAHFHFSPQEFDLPAFGKKKISYTLRLPKEAVGGYYGVLFFEKMDQKTKDITGVNIITRVGTLLFFEASTKKKSALIEHLDMAQLLLTGELSNTGNVVLTPQGTFYVMDKDGLVVDRGEMKNYYLPPGAAASFAIDLSPKLGPGTFTIVLTLDLGAGDSVVKEVDFEKNATNTLQIKQIRN